MAFPSPSTADSGPELPGREQLQQRYVQNKAELTSHVSTAVGAELRMLTYGGDSPIFYYDAPAGAEIHSGLEHQNVPDDKASSVVQEVMTRFENCRFSWVTGPSEQARLESTLVAKAFILNQMESVMAVDLKHHPPSETSPSSITSSPQAVSVEGVLTVKGVQKWVRAWAHNAPEADIAQWTKIYTTVIGYVSPRQLHMFAAKDVDGTMIGTGYIHCYAGVAAIHAIFVAPGFRRKGIGKALTAYGMLYAKNSGYDIAMLTASSLGMGIFKSLGFQEFGTVKLYAWRPSGRNNITSNTGTEKEKFGSDRLEREARRIQKLEKKRYEKEHLEKQQIEIWKMAEELERQKRENDYLEKEKGDLKRAVEFLSQRVEEERLEKETIKSEKLETLRNQEIDIFLINKLEKSRNEESKRIERLRSEKNTLEAEFSKRVVIHTEQIKEAKVQEALLQEMRLKAEQAEKQKEAAERLAAQLKKDAQMAQDALEAEQDGWCIV